MEFDVNLYNATVIGENPDTAFIIEGKKLHAVEQQIAAHQKDKSKPELILPIMTDALKGLIKYANGKVEGHFLELDFEQLKNKEKLIGAIEHIYTHLSHQERQKLSSLIHHTQAP